MAPTDLPPRRGMLGPRGGDTFPEFNGWRPPAKRSEIEQFDRSDAVIILDGDGTGHGGHRHGTGWGKSEFPAGWEERALIRWVRGILDHPVDGFDHGRGFTVFGAEADVCGIVVLNNDGRWAISTAYPMSAVQWRRWKSMRNA